MTLCGAMFGAPALLWGLGLAAAPLIIHLLFRRRYQVIDWAAMRWLIAAVQKRRRRLRIEQLLLLLLRTALVALVVLAMALPMLDSAPALLASTSPAVHNVLVIDDSMSMQYFLAGKSRWEQAKTLAHQILDDARPGDLASVVVMGASPTVLVGDPSPYLADVAREIDALKPQDGLCRIEPAVDLVADVLKNSRSSRRRIFFITDMQRASWLAEESTDVSGLGKKLQSLSAQADVVVFDVGSPESPNSAVLAVEQRDPLAILQRPTLISARVASFSTKPREDVKVELLVDGQVEAAEPVKLPPGEIQTVHFSAVFREPGDRVVSVRLPEDSLRRDDERRLIARVRESLSVLLIDGEPSGEPFASETDYLKVALAPVGKDGKPPLIRVEVKQESELLDAKLEEFDLVALCNVARWTTVEADRIKAYLRRGGGVVFFLGSQTNLDAYNQVLFEEGKGPFPLRLDAVVGKNGPHEQFTTFNPLDYRHPIIEQFKNAERAGLLTAKVFRYVKGEIPKESGAQVALAYQNGDPAIVLRPFEGGQVGVVTTSADLDGNSWAVSPSYVPVVQELVRALASSRVRRNEVLVGEPIVLPLLSDGLDAQGTVAAPPVNGESSPLVPFRVEERGAARQIVFGDTDRAGVYRIGFIAPAEETWAVAVNPPPAESNLQHLGESELKTLFPGWKFRLLDRWESHGPSSPGAGGRGGGLHRPMLYAALMFLFLETYLAWRFGRHA